MVAMVPEGDRRTEARKLLDLIHANLLQELEAANQRIADLESQLAAKLPAIDDAKLAEAVAQLRPLDIYIPWLKIVLDALATREPEHRAWEAVRKNGRVSICIDITGAATCMNGITGTGDDPVDAVLAAEAAAKGAGDA